MVGPVVGTVVGTGCVAGRPGGRSNRAHHAMKPCYVGAGALVLLILSLSLALVQLASALPAPVWGPLFLAGGSGRNIRHLPCVSRRSGEAGICMFAYTCMKANGTHLGTCIDRFYFGSCCRVEPAALDSLLPPPETLGENHIESGNHPILDFVNIIPPVLSSMSPSTTSTMKTTALSSSSTRSTTAIPSPTTSSPFFLSTFQSVQEHDTSTEKPTRTENDDLLSSSARPTTSTAAPKPSTTTTQVNKPVSQYPPPTPKPVKPTTNKPKPSKPTSTTKRPATSTRKPATTTRKPVSTTRKPVHPTTHKPVTTTKTTTKLTTRPTTPSSTTLSSTRPTPSTASTNLNVSINEVEPTVPTSTESPPSLVTWSWVTEVDVNKSTAATTSKPLTFTSTTKSSSIEPPTTPSPSTYQPTKKPTTMTQPTKPSTSQPSTEPLSTPQPASRPSTSQPSTKPSTYPTSTKPTTSQPSTKPSTSSQTTKPPTYSTSTKFTTHAPTTIPTTPNTTASWSKPPQPLVTSPHAETTTAPSTDGWVQLEISTHNKFNTTTVAPTTKYPSQPDTQTPTYPPSLWTMSMSSAEAAATLSSIISSLTNATTSSMSSSSESSSASVTPPMIASTTEMPASSTPTSASFGPAEPSSSPWTATPPATPPPPSAQSTPSPPPPIYTVDSGLDIEQLNSLNMSDYKQVCGRRLFPESRIVGGDKASFGKWPWQISLRQWRTSTFLHKCGAALLNENWAITAAHCVDNVPPTHLMLRLGEHDLSTESEPYGYKEHRVQLIASHPQFDSRTFEYDLAMLRFYEPVTFQPNILPICVPEDSTNFVGQTAHVTGWGRIYEEGPLPSVLQEVSVPVINNSVCETMYHAAGYIEHIPNIFICAGWRKGGFDSCEGDSGGPMVIQRPSDKRWILAGVISWGIGCAEPNQPGVYTRISEFRDWINQIIQF